MICPIELLPNLVFIDGIRRKKKFKIESGELDPKLNAQATEPLLSTKQDYLKPDACPQNALTWLWFMIHESKLVPPPPLNLGHHFW